MGVGKGEDNADNNHTVAKLPFMSSDDWLKTTRTAAAADDDDDEHDDDGERRFTSYSPGADSMAEPWVSESPEVRADAEFASAAAKAAAANRRMATWQQHDGGGHGGHGGHGSGVGAGGAQHMAASVARTPGPAVEDSAEQSVGGGGGGATCEVAAAAAGDTTPTGLRGSSRARLERLAARQRGQKAAAKIATLALEL